MKRRLDDLFALTRPPVVIPSGIDATYIHIRCNDFLVDSRIEAGLDEEGNPYFIEAPKGYDGPPSLLFSSYASSDFCSMELDPVDGDYKFKRCLYYVSGSTPPARRRFESWLQRRCERKRTALAQEEEFAISSMKKCACCCLQ